MQQLEPQLYAATVASKLHSGTTEMKAILSLEEEGRSLRQRAQSTWDAIPAGTTIRVNGVPVGKNAEVQRLNKQAEKFEGQVADSRKQFTAKYASSLKGTQWSQPFDQREAALAEVQRAKDQHGWYYNSPVRFALKAIGAIAFVLMLIPVLGCGLCIRAFFLGTWNR